MATDLRYWNRGDPPYWFRSARGLEGYEPTDLVIVWREESYETQLRKYPSVMRPRWYDTMNYEDWERGWDIADAMICESEGRPSWREAAITRRVDGLTEDFMHEEPCYSW